MSKLIKSVQRGLHSLGYEVVPYPPNDWVRQRDSLRHILHKLSIDCVIDVGANCGQYGEQLRDIGYTGWIVSFEPVKAHFEELSKQARSRPPWKAFRYALGANNGTAEININADSVLSSFLPSRGPTATLPRNSVVSKELVEVRRLDSVFEECMSGIPATRFYLKLDTQGFDLEVLRGCEAILHKIAGVQTEVSFIPIYDGMPGYAESLRAFQQEGFEVVDFMPVTRTADGLLMLEMDCLLARRQNPV